MATTQSNKKITDLKFYLQIEILLYLPMVQIFNSIINTNKHLRLTLEKNECIIEIQKIIKEYNETNKLTFSVEFMDKFARTKKTSNLDKEIIDSSLVYLYCNLYKYKRLNYFDLKSRCRAEELFNKWENFTKFVLLNKCVEEFNFYCFDLDNKNDTNFNKLVNAFNTNYLNKTLILNFYYSKDNFYFEEFKNFCEFVLGINIKIAELQFLIKVPISNDKHLSYFSEAIKKASIEMLSIYNNFIPFYLDIEKPIFDCFGFNKSLKKIDFVSTKLGKNVINTKNLFENLQKNEVIEELSFFDNCLGDNPDNVECLTNLFKRNKSLKKLNLKDNNLGYTSLKEFFEAIEINENLNEIILDNNQIGSKEENFSGLCKAIEKNKKLGLLSINYIYLKELERYLNILSDILKLKSDKGQSILIVEYKLN